MASGRLINVPFALGQDEETCPRELPLGPFREVVNVRQKRGSQFGMRPDYLAATMTEFDGTLIPYDLYNLNGRLFALGNRQATLSPAPTDVFEYVEQPGGAWKGTLPVGGAGTRVPAATRLRNMGQVPDGVTGIQAVRVAALNGFVCTVHGFGIATGGTTNYVHIFRASTDSTILFAPVALANAQVVAVGSSFWIIGVDASNDIAAHRFDTTVDDDLQSITTLFTGTITGAFFAVCDVNDIPVAQFAIFTRDGVGVTRILRFNEAGVSQASFAGPAVSPDAMGIEADADANQIMVATRVGAADINVSTYNLTTNALIAGPTAIFGEAVTGSFSLIRSGLGVTTGILVTEDATNRVLKALFVSTTITSIVILPTHNYHLAGTGVHSTLGTIFPVISGDDNNQLLVFDALSPTAVTVAAQLDEHIANPLIGAVNKSGQVVQDRVNGTVTNAYYWARIIEGTDGQTIPVVAQFYMGSLARRQACQVGNELFVTGGVPLSFDARQVVEQGFLERPTFVSSTPSNTGGDLLSGAEYDYVAVFQWTDGQNRISRSQVSDVQTVTMGASDDTVTHVVYGPHSMRKDSNTGSVPIISIYRTDATALNERAIIIGSRNFAGSPATAGDFSGLTLQISADGGGTQTVTFGAGDNTITELIAAINSQTTGLTARSDEAVITIESDVDGSLGSVTIIGGTTTVPGVGFSGFFTGQANTGTTSFVKGSVFGLAATAVVPLADDFGEPVSIIDNTSDEDVLLAEKVYTSGERGAITGVLENESAPACEFCAAVGARVFVGGLANRSEVAISKELFPSEGIAFSSNFSFRSTVDGDVTAVAGLDGTPVAFTADAIFLFSNELPDDAGAQGELGTPRRLPSEGGCSNANSIILTSFGLFYQARDTKLMLIPRGGGAPVWAGKAIQDTLTSFPVITGAAYSDVDHTVLFTCQNSGGTASTIVVLDLRLSGFTKNGFVATWYRDTFASAQVIRACTNYLGRLVYIDTATVRLQSTSDTPATFIPYNIKTGSIAPFGGNGWGKFIAVTVSGEFRGNATLTCRISYNDGVTYDTMTAFDLTTATFAAGGSFTRQWWPAVRKGSTFVLDFQVTVQSGATAGLNLNEYTVEVIGPKVARIRTSTAERGG